VCGVLDGRLYVLFWPAEWFFILILLVYFIIRDYYDFKV
jgi:hypothetical protein